MVNGVKASIGGSVFASWAFVSLATSGITNLEYPNPSTLSSIVVPDGVVLEHSTLLSHWVFRDINEIAY